MTRRLLLLTLLVFAGADRAAADPEVINPIYRKPEQAPPPPQEAGPVRVPPKVEASSCVPPRYPSASAAGREEGTVGLDFLIAADGRIAASRIVQSSGHPRLDEAAREAFSLCRFTPGTADGVPEQAWTHLRYRWAVQ